MIAALVLVVACGDDGTSTGALPGDGTTSSTTSTTDIPLCRDARHVVFFSLNGVITADQGEIGRWLNDPDYNMVPMDGAAELTTAYHDLGYELLYTSRGTDDLELGGLPYTEAIEGWLEANGLPIGERARFRPGIGTDGLGLVDELVNVRTDDGQVHAVYTNNAAEVENYVSGGVARDQISTIDVGDNLAEYVPPANDLTPVCRTDAVADAGDVGGDDDDDDHDENSEG